MDDFNKEPEKFSWLYVLPFVPVLTALAYVLLNQTPSLTDDVAAWIIGLLLFVIVGFLARSVEMK